MFHANQTRSYCPVHDSTITASTKTIERLPKNSITFSYKEALGQGFPTWGTCTPRCTFAHPKGYI